MPQPTIAPPPTCGGRFAIHDFLGAGGMGSVHSAYDHLRHSQVALKVMRRASGSWVYRFKNEFRTLAGVVHPNLVTLHDLIHWDGEWLFTMELVPGVTFSQARPLSPTPGATATSDERPSPAARRAPPAGPTPPFLTDVFQVSDALRQLCDGLDHLHRLGIAHGDVKPSNVLITPSGRVVILDFGISRSWRAPGDEGEPRVLLGTRGYLAPEQQERHAPTPASDLFALGVTLFETLSGQQRSPDLAPAFALQASRGDGLTDTSALRQRELLERLCLRLLDPDPAARPSAADVREAVAPDAASAGRQTARKLSRPGGAEVPFVARGAELRAIRAAVLDERPAAPRVVLVSGESGIGKTELLRRALDDELRATCLVLDGACYEREQVPYRALDRVVDALSSRLLAVEPEELQALSWADLAVVARMFPALRRVPELDRLCDRMKRADDRDPPALRRAAAGTLGALLALVARDRRVLLAIDDLHWGDEESGAVLRELLLDDEALDLVLVGCHRQPLEGSALLSRLLGAEPRPGLLDLRVEALPAGDSEGLARTLLGPEADPAHVARVASEASGNPFLIRELVEFGAGADLGDLALRSAVGRHVAQLPERARAILEVLAVAGRRLDLGVVLGATGSGPTFEAAVILLRSQHLIRASDSRGEAIEPYHDRIRQELIRGLAPEALAARHRDLARALEARGEPDPALLGFHLEGAGDRTRAADCLLRAAGLAEASLAPLNAAAHYARVATLTAPDDARHLAALGGQARSLAAAGRGASAGPLYLQLAARAPPGEALALRRRAARAFVSAGDFARAREALGEVLRAAGIRVPASLPGVLAQVVRERLWIWRRKDAFTPRPEADIPPGQLLRIDAYETASELYSSIDLVRSYLAHSTQLREALTLGEPGRVARALIDEVVMGSIGGERASRRGLELLRVAAEALGQGEFREERTRIRYATGVHHLLNGRYAGVLETLAELAHAPDLRGSGIQLRTVRSGVGYARWWLGQWAVTSREHQAWIADALERGDQFSALSHRLEQSGQWAALLEDRPERAGQQLDAALASPIAQELSFEHIAAKQSQAWVALYQGNPDGVDQALRFTREQQTYLRVQRTRAEMTVLRAFAALARGPAGLGDARRWLQALEKEAATWTQPLVRLIAGSLAAASGRPGESLSHLSAALSLCEQQGFAMFSAAAAVRLGELEGGAGGAARREAALARLVSQGVRAPERMVRMLAPGFAASPGLARA